MHEVRAGIAVIVDIGTTGRYPPASLAGATTNESGGMAPK
jgi:hypothetical protein